MLPLKDYEQFYSITEDGKVYSHRKQRFLNGLTKEKGYRQVYLTGETPEKKGWRYIHELVILAYGDNCPSDKHEVNHKDFNPSNNRIDNLEWVTHKENMLHAREAGRWDGKGCGRPAGFKMSEESKKKMAAAKYRPVRAIGEDILNFDSIEALIQHFGIYRKKFNRYIDADRGHEGYRFELVEKQE